MKSAEVDYQAKIEVVQKVKVEVGVIDAPRSRVSRAPTIRTPSPRISTYGTSASTPSCRTSAASAT